MTATLIFCTKLVILVVTFDELRQAFYGPGDGPHSYTFRE